VALDRTVREAWESVGADGVLLAEVDGTVRADGTRLHQLLENLLDNAVTHGGDGVTVTVGETADGFYVADDGPGVPDSEREAVFDRGYSTTDGGTGFGLRIVQQVAEAHGWTVSLTESEAGGARFEVTGVEFTEEAEESWYRR
jgi:signal transduction histidine kinase